MNNHDFFDDLGEKEIEDLMKYVTPFSEENERNIKNKFMQKAEKKQKKLPRRKIIISVALASTLFFSTLVYAKVLDFNRIYQIVFGDKAQYIAEHIQPFEDKKITGGFQSESEYDGIVVKLISAVNDEDKLRIFLTVTDTTMDRLSETMSLDQWGLSQGNGGGCEVVDYDQDTKTATILITSQGSEHNGQVNFSIHNILSGKAVKENQIENGIDLYSILKDYTPKIIERADKSKEYTTKEAENKVYVVGGASQDEEGQAIYSNAKLLALDEKEVRFKNIDWSYISNVGFVNGYLHIQTCEVHSENDLSSINFLNSKGEVLYNGHLQICYIPISDANGGTAVKQYKDMIYKGITDVEQLKELSVSIDYLEIGNVIEGTWEIAFDVPEKMIKMEINVDKEIMWNGKEIAIDKILLSPLGVTIHLPQNVEYTNIFDEDDSAYLTYTDGTIVTLDNIFFSTTGDEISNGVVESESTLNFGGKVVEIEKVESIVINGEVFSVLH